MVYRVLAMRTVVSLSTLTRKSIYVISARRPVGARIGFALVYVNLTEFPSPTSLANAFLIEHSVYTHSVNAGILSAKILLDVTPFSGEPRGTVTCEIIDQVFAFRSHGAWTLSTIINVPFTS